MHKNINVNQLLVKGQFVLAMNELFSKFFGRVGNFYIPGATILTSLLLLTSSAAAQDTLWTKIFGGESTDVIKSIKQTPDNGYIMTGYTDSYGAGGYDVYLVKSDSFGDTVWTKTFGAENNDGGMSVCLTNDGGYVVAGYTTNDNKDLYITKVDSTGNQLWEKTYGGSSLELACCVDTAHNGGYIIVGYSSNTSSEWNDFYVLRTDSDGDTLWTRMYGSSNPDVAYWVTPTTDNCYAVCGYAYTSEDESYTNAWLIKIDDNGDSLWSGAYGGESSEEAHVVKQTIDGGFIISGHTQSYGNELQYYVVKTDSLGNMEWHNNYGTEDREISYGICELPDEKGYIIGGFSYNWDWQWFNYYLVRIDAAGDTLWTQRYGDLDDIDYCYSLELSNDGAFIMAGYNNTFSPGNHINCYIMKINGDYMTEIDDVPEVPMNYGFSENYPNPFNANTKIQFSCAKNSSINIEIYNITGQFVRSFGTIDYPAGDHSVTWDSKDDIGNSVSSGVYFYRIKSADFCWLGEMTLLK